MSPRYPSYPYPQRATADDWKKRFGHLDARQKEIRRNSLGNLVALSRPKNAALSNRSFPDKKKAPKKHRVTSRGLTQKSKSLSRRSGRHKLYWIVDCE